MDAFTQLGTAGIDVIVDAGRVGPSGLPGPLIDAAAVLGLAVRTNLRSVVSARVHLATLQEQRAAGPAASTLGLLVVGPGRPYGSAEVSKALAVPVLATVPDDAAVAAHLSDGTVPPADDGPGPADPGAADVRRIAGGAVAPHRRAGRRLR